MRERDLSQPPPRTHAFTLVEVVMTVAIAGVLATLAVQSLSANVARTNARGEVRAVEAFLGKAGPLARMRRECAQVSAEDGRKLVLTLHPRSLTTGCDFTTTSTRQPNTFRFPETGGNSRFAITPSSSLRVDGSGSVLDSSVPWKVDLVDTTTDVRATFEVLQGLSAVRRRS